MIGASNILFKYELNNKDLYITTDVLVLYLNEILYLIAPS